MHRQIVFVACSECLSSPPVLQVVWKSLFIFNCHWCSLMVAAVLFWRLWSRKKNDTITHTRWGERAQKLPHANLAVTSICYNDRSRCYYRLFYCISRVPFLCMEANRNKHFFTHFAETNNRYKMWSGVIEPTDRLCLRHNFLTIICLFLLLVTWSVAWAYSHVTAIEGT